MAFYSEDIEQIGDAKVKAIYAVIRQFSSRLVHCIQFQFWTFFIALFSSLI